MTDEKMKHKRRFWLKPRFLLFLLYVGVYIFFRHRGDIILSSSITTNTPTNIKYLEYSVYPSHNNLLWQRQIFRAIYSPLMVIEENIWLLIKRSGISANDISVDNATEKVRSLLGN